MNPKGTVIELNENSVDKHLAHGDTFFKDSETNGPDVPR